MKKIKNLKDLLDYWGADTPQGLNRRVYKSTDCGAMQEYEYAGPVGEEEDEDG